VSSASAPFGAQHRDTRKKPALDCIPQESHWVCVGGYPLFERTEKVWVFHASSSSIVVESYMHERGKN
jgi:hypothetical protein